MSLLGKIAALFSGGSARKVCVVDGDRLVGGDRVGPGERFQTLNKLARFAAREEMKIKVVFGGRPLREADEGSDFNGVQVYYGESPEDVRKKITKILSSIGRSSVVLIVGDAALEQEQTENGYSTIRTSTMRKAMDPAVEGGGGRENGGRDGRERGDRSDRGDRGDRGDRRGRNRNRGRRPQPTDSREGNTSENQNHPDDSQPSNEGDNQDNRGNRDNRDNRENRGNSSADASVKNLIDLVE